MLTAILVDDEKLVLDMLRDHINWAGLGVTVSGVAKNGQEALSLYLERRPDFIFTDVKMPVMDGLALIRRVRENDWETKAVIISGHDEFSCAKEAMRLNVRDYVLKPIYVTEFEALVRRLVSEHMRQRSETDELEHLLVAFFDENFSPKAVIENLITRNLPALVSKLEIFVRLLSAQAITLEQCRRICSERIDRIHGALRLEYKNLDGLAREVRDDIAAAGSPVMIREAINSYFAKALDSISRDRPPYISAHVDKIEKTIRELYMEPVTIGEIAERVHLSEGYVRNIFKKYTGVTASDYLLRFRMEKAVELLEDPKNSIHDVSKKVGFVYNDSYFISVFKKYYGVTPNEYRKKRK